MFQKINVPIYAAYLYDAVTVYARTLDTVLKDGGSADNGTAIIEKIRNTTFTSMYEQNPYFPNCLHDKGPSVLNYLVFRVFLLDSREVIQVLHSIIPKSFY